MDGSGYSVANIIFPKELFAIRNKLESDSLCHCQIIDVRDWQEFVTVVLVVSTTFVMPALIISNMDNLHVWFLSE